MNGIGAFKNIEELRPRWGLVSICIREMILYIEYIDDLVNRPYH